MTHTYPHGDGAAGPPPVLPSAATPRGLIGQHIGSYRIVRELGHGGMGVVYEAVHEQLGQRAAVKTLKPEMSLSPDFAQRFFTEARAVSIAQHPGLVRVFDFGQLPDRTLYILMEFLDGEPLSSRLLRGPLDEPTALRLARQIASAVQAAHERGIVHRDLKPSNLFVVPDVEAPAGERVKILDFGLAKIIAGPDDSEKGAAEAVRNTKSGIILGTPVYMSPEQCRSLANTDAKTDVYSLGVLLFEMLAGSPPFCANTAGDLIAMHIGQAPPRLDQKVPTASAAVTVLLSDMLAKEPVSRPTMAQVAERLQQAAAAWRPPLPKAARKGVARRAGAALALALLLALAALALRSQRTGPAPSPAPAPALVPAPALEVSVDAAPHEQALPAASPRPAPAAAPAAPSRPPASERTASKHRALRPAPSPSSAASPPAVSAPAPQPSQPPPAPPAEDVDVPVLR